MPRSRTSSLLTEYQYEGRLTDDLIEALEVEASLFNDSIGLDEDEEIDLPEEEMVDDDDLMC